MPRYNKSKYSIEQSSKIRFNILEALNELATFKGIDIRTMQTTSPYSITLNEISCQKIAQELKKMIDVGMVVKEIQKGTTVKYMLRARYNELYAENKIKKNSYGYGDYRDEKEEDDPEVIEKTCAKIVAAALRPKYEPMW